MQVRSKTPTLDGLFADTTPVGLLDDTPPDGTSIKPCRGVCAPLLAERARRKAVDQHFEIRLKMIARNTRITMVALLTTVGFASLEYAGILGTGKAVWARAVFDALNYILVGK